MALGFFFELANLEMMSDSPRVIFTAGLWRNISLADLTAPCLRTIKNQWQ
jgi:hypothetical protein